MDGEPANQDSLWKRLLQWSSWKLDNVVALYLKIIRDTSRSQC